MSVASKGFAELAPHNNHSVCLTVAFRVESSYFEFMLRCSEEEVHPLRPAQCFHQEAELFCLELVEQAGCALGYCRAVPLELFNIGHQGVLQDERVHLQQVGLLLELSLEGEGVVDFLLQLDGVFEELCEGVFVVVEEGGDERVACGGLEIL